jgi:STE24 endopeptidase
MSLFTLIFLLTLGVGTAIQWWLMQRHLHHVRQHQAQVPPAFVAKIDLAAHQKAAHYTVAKLRFGQILLGVEVLLLLLWTLGGMLDSLDTLWRTKEWSMLWTGVAVMLSFILIGALLEVPASMYKTFSLEARFGFNRTTLPTFISDTLKHIVLTVIIATPLLALVLWLMESMGTLWWVWVWAVFISFNLLLLWAYPAFIAPLFNQFKPLEGGELRTRIENLLQRNGFSCNGVFVMDGSRRSGHGNAYFTGLGRNKRIVFFDTLLERLSPSEIEAVLAHEIGHFKRHHLLKRLLLIATISLAALALLGWLMQQTWFYHGLGLSQGSTYMALLLFSLVLPVFSIFFVPILAYLSRQHEFEADAFAHAQTNAQDLIHALVKLYRDNANTLTPDPLYSAFYDSHPPAPVRIAYLEGMDVTQSSGA